MMFALASDHAAVTLKEQILAMLTAAGHTVTDFTTEGAPALHYAQAADRVCNNVLLTGATGILLCGTGQGTAMRANRYNGIRAALVVNTYMAEMARAHNNANILVLGARVVTPLCALECVNTFINTAYEAGRHEPRVQAIDAPLAKTVAKNR